MFYFEFHGPSVSAYSLVFVCRKDIYYAGQIQKEWRKFICIGDNNLFFEQSAEYTEDFFIDYCTNDMDV